MYKFKGLTSNLSEAVMEETIWAMMRLRLLYVGWSLWRLMRHIS